MMQMMQSMQTMTASMTEVFTKNQASMTEVFTKNQASTATKLERVLHDIEDTVG
jgi:hypothetical protein